METYEKILLVRHLKAAERHYEEILREANLDSSVRAIVVFALDDCRDLIKRLQPQEKS